MFNFLNNPLETFKSYSYNLDFVNLYSSNKYLIPINNLSTNKFFFSEDLFLTNNFLSFLVTGTGLILLLSVFFYFKTINDTKSFFYTILIVLLFQISFYISGIQSYVNTYILMDGS